MNPEQLLAHYDRVSEAPDAIVRLRRFVLDLAVRGKLVPQDPADEPASELLKRLEAEKARLMKAGEIKRSMPNFPAVMDEDALYRLPSNWQWVRFSNIADFSAGRTPPRKGASFWNTGDHAWISIADMEDGQVVMDTKETVSHEAKDKVFKADPEAPGTMIMSFKLTIGKIARLGIPAFHNEGIISISPYIEEIDPFLFKILPQFAKQGELKGAIKGATLNRKSIADILLPLPPLAEQRRIVAKVDELMALLERLAATRAEREATRDRVTAASLARLTAPATDAKTFPAHARFALDNLSVLTARSDQFKQLRRTILDLAVRGRLVPQDPADEPASELLKRIEAEKARLVKAGESRKPKDVPPLNSADQPFCIPGGWAWTQIASLGVIKPRNKAPDDTLASFVPMPMIPSKYGMPHEHEPRTWGEIKKGYTHFSEGDVGVAKITPCFENGKSVVFRNLRGGIGSGTTELHVIRPLFLEAEYIILFLKSPYFIEGGIPKMTGTAGQKRVPFEYFSSSPFPLPPLAEQRRIVAKVNELMALLERLEAACSACETTRQSLLEALLREDCPAGAGR